MKILIADDDAVSRRLVDANLRTWRYETVVTADGREAWEALQHGEDLAIAILDWMMPGIDGAELCGRIRKDPGLRATYVILLTAKGAREDVVAGLQAGADDYITKPFFKEELRARLEAAVRIVGLQQRLAERVAELQQALQQIKHLHGLLPICAYCKSVRNDSNYWQSLEEYLTHHSEATFSHGICPACYEKHVQPDLDELESSFGPARS